MESNNPNDPRPSGYFDNLVNVRQSSVSGATAERAAETTAHVMAQPPA